MDVVRRLALLSVRIASGSELTATLQAVADGVVDVVGFGMAVVNHRLPSGDFAAVGVAGPDDLKAALLGAISPSADMEHTLAAADRWGNLCFIPEERFEQTAAAQWVPDVPDSDEPDAWRARDMLLAPMWSDGGDLIGVLSVDQPPGGKRPSQEVRELLEIFASQAGIAVAAVGLRELHVAERTAREGRLIDQAQRDALTGLANRRVLDERLLRSIGMAGREGRVGAVLFCDLDQFKRFNDEHGHVAGDAVLQACARAISEHVRDDDLVARVGGDEFVIVADGMTEDTAQQLADRLRGIAISIGDGEPVGVTMSVGIAVFDETSATSPLIAMADAAMYADKPRPR